MSGRPVGGEELLSRLADDASVHVHKIDLVREAALLIVLDAAAVKTAAFLDDRVLRPGMPSAEVALDRAVEAARAIRNERPLHFIFHTGHVGSTLLSRLLEEIDGVTALREPASLRQLALAHDTVTAPDSLVSETRLQALVETFLRLWGRGRGGPVVLKATSSAGRIAAQLLTRRPQARAVYMNLEVEPFLTSLLAGPNALIDLKSLGPERMRRLTALGAPAPAALHRMSIGEMAAMAWLAETWAQVDAMSAFGERVIAVDFDRLLANVGEEVLGIAGHMGLSAGAGFAARVAASPALKQYSKAQEHAYSPRLRQDILADSRRRNHDEIRNGLAWIDGMAASHASVARMLSARSAISSL